MAKTFQKQDFICLFFVIDFCMIQPQQQQEKR